MAVEFKRKIAYSMRIKIKVFPKAILVEPYYFLYCWQQRTIRSFLFDLRRQKASIIGLW